MCFGALLLSAENDGPTEDKGTILLKELCCIFHARSCCTFLLCSSAFLAAFPCIKKNDNDGLSEADGTSGTILCAKRI